MGSRHTTPSRVGLVFISLVLLSCADTSPDESGEATVTSQRADVATVSPATSSDPIDSAPDVDAADSTEQVAESESPDTAPSDGVRLTLSIEPRDRANLDLAVDHVVGRCMEAAGFEWIYLDPGSTLAAARSRDASYRGEFPVDAVVESEAYADPGHVQRPDRTNDDVARELGESQRAAYNVAIFGPASDDGTTVDMLGGGSFGVSDSGCLALGRTEVFGSLEAALEYEAGDANRTLAARQRALSDPAVQSALEEWRACMASAGFSYEHFGQARSAAASEAAAAASAIHRADVGCTESSDLRRRFLQGYEAALGELYEQAGAELLDRQRLVRQAIDRLAGEVD